MSLAVQVAERYKRMLEHRHHVRLLLTVVALASAVPVQAQNLAFWGDLTTSVIKTKRVSWTGTASYRSDDDTGGVGRLGTDFLFPLSSGMSITAGYLAVKSVNPSQADFSWDNRLTGRFGYPLGKLRSLRFSGGSQFEQHFPAGEPDFSRYRQQFDLKWNRGRASPLLQQDFAFQNGRGFFRSRSRVGMIWTLRNERELRTLFQFQTVKGSNGGWQPQYAVVVQLRFGRPWFHGSNH